MAAYTTSRFAAPGAGLGEYLLGRGRRRPAMGSPAGATMPRPAPPGVPEPAPAVAAPPQAAPQPSAEPPPRRAALMAQQAAQQASPPPGQPTPGRDDSDLRTLSVIDALASGLSQHRTGRGFRPQFWSGLRQERDTADERAAEEAKKAALEAEQKDAADYQSQVSQNAQRALSPLLKQLGMRDEEIAFLSKSDLDELGKGGQLQMGLAQARAKAAEARAQAEAQAAAEAEKRAYDEQRWSERNQITSAQQDRRTDKMAGITTNRMIQGALLGHQLAQDRAIEADARRRADKIEDERRKGKPDPTAYSLPGTRVVDENRMRQAIADDPTRRKVEDAAAAAIAIDAALGRMRQLRAQHGMTLDQRVVGDYEAERMQAIGALSTLNQTGTIQDAEYRRYKRELADITPSVSDAWRVLNPSRDPVLDRLTGVQNAIKRNANTRLRTMAGLELDEGGGGQTTAPAPEPSVAPQTIDDLTPEEREMLGL